MQRWSSVAIYEVMKHWAPIGALRHISHVNWGHVFVEFTQETEIAEVSAQCNTC
jgi:hypothetical protein